MDSVHAATAVGIVAEEPAALQPMQAAQPEAASSQAPWARLDKAGRAAWAAQAVAAAVSKIIGRTLAGHEPLMSAGLDSLGALPSSDIEASSVLACVPVWPGRR